MKNVLLTAIMLATVLFTSCDDDDASPAAINVNFENTEVGISTTSTEVSASVVFSRATEDAGSIELSLNAGGLIYGADADFHTDLTQNSATSFTLEYEAGVESVSFSVAAGSGLNIEQDETISIVIANVGDNFVIGNNSTLSITFGENFVVTSGYVTADVGGNARTHLLYVDLEKGTEARVDRNSFDLALESAGDGFNILLNTATGMLATNTGELAFSAIDGTDTVGMVLTGAESADIATASPLYTGDFSETKFFGWDADGTQSNVFIINRGSVANQGANRGWKKVQISKTTNGYNVLSADLDGSNEQQFEIEKSADYNFKYVHFENGEVAVEPATESWDIVLTPITQNAYSNGMFFGAYNSQAALHNYYGAIEVGVIDLDESGTTFEEIDLSTATASINDAADDYNAIGLSWRVLGSNFAFTLTNLVYCVKDAEGNIFKLQFTDYYNAANEVGPEFKYELLK